MLCDVVLFTSEMFNMAVVVVVQSLYKTLEVLDFGASINCTLVRLEHTQLFVLEFFFIINTMS